MKATITILDKTIVREYYRQNAGFLFVILLFATSFLRKMEHIELGKLAVHLPLVLALYFLIWTIYTFKALLFTLRMIENPAYSFLCQLILVPKSKRLLALVVMQVKLLGLVIAYAAFIVSLGIQEKTWEANIAIILMNLLLIFVGIIAIEYRIKRPNVAQRIGQFNQLFAFQFRTIYSFFFIRHLFNKQPILLFLSKIFACLLLLGLCQLYPTDEYDERLLLLAGLFAAAANIIIITHHFEFENQYLPFLKNLPLAIPKRFLSYSITFLILLLPEFSVFFKYLPSTVSYAFFGLNCCFIFSLNLINISLLYINIPAEKLMVRIFYGGVFYFLLIMFKIPILLITFINLAVGFWIFKRNFYQSEWIIS